MLNELEEYKEYKRLGTESETTRVSVKALIGQEFSGGERVLTTIARNHLFSGSGTPASAKKRDETIEALRNWVSGCSAGNDGEKSTDTGLGSLFRQELNKRANNAFKGKEIDSKKETDSFRIAFFKSVRNYLKKELPSAYDKKELNKIIVDFCKGYFAKESVFNSEDIKEALREKGEVEESLDILLQHVRAQFLKQQLKKNTSKYELFQLFSRVLPDFPEKIKAEDLIKAKDLIEVEDLIKAEDLIEVEDLIKAEDLPDICIFDQKKAIEKFQPEIEKTRTILDFPASIKEEPDNEETWLSSLNKKFGKEYIDRFYKRCKEKGKSSNSDKLRLLFSTRDDESLKNKFYLSILNVLNSTLKQNKKEFLKKQDFLEAQLEAQKEKETAKKELYTIGKNELLTKRVKAVLQPIAPIAKAIIKVDCDLLKDNEKNRIILYFINQAIKKEADQTSKEKLSFSDLTWLQLMGNKLKEDWYRFEVAPTANAISAICDLGNKDLRFSNSIFHIDAYDSTSSDYKTITYEGIVAKAFNMGQLKENFLAYNLSNSEKAGFEETSLPLEKLWKTVGIGEKFASLEEREDADKKKDYLLKLTAVYLLNSWKEPKVGFVPFNQIDVANWIGCKRDDLDFSSYYITVYITDETASQPLIEKTSIDQQSFLRVHEEWIRHFSLIDAEKYKKNKEKYTGQNTVIFKDLGAGKPLEIVK